MLSALSGSVAFAPTTGVRAPTVTTASVRMETKADLEVLAKKLNPTVGFYDPLGLADAVVDGSNEAAIGYLRHAEIKHGRVAMAAFVGYCVQSNGICFPWNLQGPLPISAATANLPVISFADISAAGGPADQWDALPSAAKLQILVVIGFLEMWSETSTVLKLDGEAHYVRGGKPGYFPKLNRKDDAAFPHPVPLNLWDPFGFTSKMSPERKEKALLAEINNGRLAQIGIIGMISASKGLQVPGLDSIEGIKPYAGEVMAPFASGDASLPFVADMLKSVGTYGW
mmetsp:Transcript_19023/g.47780  ORF Transcript_19023/g.47780 Transcript_19023/m.47780 type:complete len:284 (-) Transcript_19023:267-1118(-)